MSIFFCKMVINGSLLLKQVKKQSIIILHQTLLKIISVLTNKNGNAIICCGLLSDYQKLYYYLLPNLLGGVTRVFMHEGLRLGISRRRALRIGILGGLFIYLFIYYQLSLLLYYCYQYAFFIFFFSGNYYNSVICLRRSLLGRWHVGMHWIWERM